MKLLSVSFALILIALVLPLNDASESGEITKPKETERQSNEAKRQQQEANKQTAPPDKPVIEQAPHSPYDRSTTKDQTHQQEEQPWKPSDIAIAVFTGCLVLVGIAQVFVYLRQAKYMRRGLRLTRQSIDVAKASVAVSERSVTAALLALRSDRPYLCVEDIKLTGISQPSESGLITAFIIVANYGKGPAFIGEAVGTIRIVDGELPPRNYDGCKELGMTTVIRPGMSLPDSLMATIRQFSDKEREEFLAGDDRKYLVVYGRIKYRDLTDGEYVEGFYWHADAFSTRIGMRINSLAEPKLKLGPKTYNYHESQLGLSKPT